jgi:tetratricopeptide (TPR) repeat protein
VLLRDGDNVKALYRSARACFAIDKLDEADDALSRAVKLDPSNPSFLNLKREIAKRKAIFEKRKRGVIATTQRKRDAERALKAALKVRPSILC